jgi:phage terminase large subunit GpA-like protein
MYVNVSRSKLLINNLTTIRKTKKKTSASSIRCNHCGGPVRANGEINSCLMCSREVNHVCANCSHVRPEEVVSDSKKLSA